MNNIKRKVSHKGARQKGAQFERDVTAQINQSHCLEAIKVPLSGAVEGYPGDVIVRTFMDGEIDRERTLECKKRENISKQLWEWLEGNDALVIGRNRYKPLVIIPLEEAIRLWSKD